MGHPYFVEWVLSANKLCNPFDTAHDFADIFLGRDVLQSSFWWRKVRNRNLLNSLEWFLPASNIVHCMKDVGAVILGTAGGAHPNDNVLKDDESLLVFECLTCDGFWLNRPFTVFARITVRRVVIVLRSLHTRKFTLTLN